MIYIDIPAAGLLFRIFAIRLASALLTEGWKSLVWMELWPNWVQFVILRVRLRGTVVSPEYSCLARFYSPCLRFKSSARITASAKSRMGRRSRRLSLRNRR